MYSAFTENHIGICLSGGVVRGAAHIGVIEGLLEKGFKIDAVSGVSAGALVGLFFAAGYTPRQMLSILKSINWFKTFNIGYGGILGFKKAKNIIKSYIPYKNLEELPIYFNACALDLYSGKNVYLDKGDVVSAVLGSCALPFIFEPVSFEDMLLMDGGLTDNLPVRPLKEKFPHLKIVCVDIIPPVYINQNLGVFGNLFRSTFLIARKSMDEQKHLCDMYIAPPVSHTSIVDYRKFDELFHIGYNFIKSQIQ